MLFAILSIGGVMVAAASLSPEREEEAALPTRVVLVASPTEKGATATITDTPARTNTVRPTATITETPARMNTATRTSTPMENTAIETALSEAYLNVTGVQRVDMTPLVVENAGRTLVHLRVVVTPENNTQAMAALLRSETLRVMGVTDVYEIQVTLTDDQVLTTYSKFEFEQNWRVFSRDVEVMEISPTTYYASGAANVRGCARTRCAIVDRLTGGQAVMIVGQVDGEAVNAGNTIWYVMDTGGGARGYVYSGLMRLTQPVPAAPPVSGQTGAATPAPQQTASNVRPGNCATAVAMGLTAQQAGQWSHLDRDGDGVACYGD